MLVSRAINRTSTQTVYGYICEIIRNNHRTAVKYAVKRSSNAAHWHTINVAIPASSHTHVKYVGKNIDSPARWPPTCESTLVSVHSYARFAVGGFDRHPTWAIICARTPKRSRTCAMCAAKRCPCNRISFNICARIRASGRSSASKFIWSYLCVNIIVLRLIFAGSVIKRFRPLHVWSDTQLFTRIWSRTRARCVRNHLIAIVVYGYMQKSIRMKGHTCVRCVIRRLYRRMRFDRIYSRIRLMLLVSRCSVLFNFYERYSMSFWVLITSIYVLLKAFLPVLMNEIVSKYINLIIY